MFFSSHAFGLELPKNLNSEERKSVLEILGFGTTSKVASSPYPLGGYEGFEIGLTSELIKIEDLSRYGSTTEPQEDLNVNSLSIGKGLYNDLDLFVNFMPISSSTKISNYGAQARWKFYEARFLPVTLSVLFHGNSANFQNLITTTVFGADLIGAINVDSLGLYLGIGQANGSGRFAGGAEGVTNTGNMQTEKVSTIHNYAGLAYNFLPLFIAFQMDRYTQPIYTARLGFRY